MNDLRARLDEKMTRQRSLNTQQRSKQGRLSRTIDAKQNMHTPWLKASGDALKQWTMSSMAHPQVIQMQPHDQS